ncbi:MAG: hypothetical protein ABI460_03570 [Caldimonas sp.]
MTPTNARTGPWLALLHAPLCALLRAPLSCALLIATLALSLAACGGSNADLPPPTGPSLIQPTDQSTPVGGSATFNVGVVGGAGSTVQWQQLNGATWTDLAGATDTSLTIAGATLAQNGTQYRAVVSVGGGTLISNPATLTVTSSAVAPTVTTQPANQSVIEPATATFNVTAGGTAPLAYQWQRLVAGTWTDIAGATGASYTTPATVRANDDGAQFRVVIGNAVNSVTSNAATLTVSLAPIAPAFITQPADATVSAPATASFTVAVTGTPTPTLQWQVSADGGATWNNVSTGSGATGTTYTTAATTTAMSGFRYRALADNGIGSTLASNSALLTVNAAAVAPTIATQPANRTVTEPAAATFNVTANGTGPLAYQWQRFVGGTWTNITGATSAAYTTSATVRSNDNGAQFRVVITNAVGSVTSNAATLTVLAVTSKAWGAFQSIRTGGGDTTTNAELALDNSGNALVVWGHELSPSMGRVDIWSNRYAVGSGWGTAQVIETNDSSSTGNRQPQIAADAAGNALAVWAQSDGTQVSIWANRYVAGSGWATAELIETGNAGAAALPNIAIDVGGNALAVWSQSDGTRYNVWSNRYTAGTGWGTAELIETDNAGDAARFSAPEIAFDRSGNALAVWEQSDGTRTNIWSNRYTAGAGWGTAQLIETDNAGRALNPSLAFDGSGNALAVWEQSDGTINNIWSNRYAAGVGWGTAQLIETDDAGNGATDAHVAFDGSGNALAVWTQRDAGNRNFLQFNRYSAGVGWGTEATAATNPVGIPGPYGARFAFDSSGTALAVWNTSDGTNSLVAFGRYTAAGGWSVIGVAGGTFAQAVIPRIAVDSNGNAVAVWLQNAAAAGNRGNFSVWAARYQ